MRHAFRSLAALLFLSGCGQAPTRSSRVELEPLQSIRPPEVLLSCEWSRQGRPVIPSQLLLAEGVPGTIQDGEAKLSFRVERGAAKELWKVTMTVDDPKAEKDSQLSFANILATDRPTPLKTESSLGDFVLTVSRCPPR